MSLRCSCRASASSSPCYVRVEHPAGEARGDVDGGRDAAFAAVLQGLEQEGLGSGEDGEVREFPAEGLDAFSVAGAVFRARDRARVGVDEARDQGQAEVYTRHLRDVVEVEAQAVVADALDDLGEEAEQAFIPHALVVEGRQNEDAGGAGFERRAAQAYGVGEGAGSRSWQ